MRPGSGGTRSNSGPFSYLCSIATADTSIPTNLEPNFVFACEAVFVSSRSTSV